MPHPPSGSLGPSPPLLGDHPRPRLHTLGLGAGPLDLLDSGFCALDTATGQPHRQRRPSTGRGWPLQGEMPRDCRGDAQALHRAPCSWGPVPDVGARPRGAGSPGEGSLAWRPLKGPRRGRRQGKRQDRASQGGRHKGRRIREALGKTQRPWRCWWKCCHLARKVVSQTPTQHWMTYSLLPPGIGVHGP